MSRTRSLHPIHESFFGPTASFLLLTKSSVPQAKICDFGLALKMPDKTMMVDRELYVLHKKSSLQ
jgi:hypothetical protein